ncbi:MAG: hypothetical protein JRG91_18215 [Deltaproteobacteria bacterium]|nr:hypothetical protein [Deltaproteobacteria bacterium]
MIERTGGLAPLALAALVASCAGGPASPGSQDEPEPPGGPLVFFEESCCEDDVVCQDGNWCTGIETCDCWGECGPGEPPCLHDLGDPCLVYASPACAIDRIDPPGVGYGMGHCEIENICDCTIDADCDDGLWCNGDEICVAGRCVFGVDRCTAACETCNELTDSCDAMLGGSCGVVGDCCGDPGDCIVWTCVGGACVAEPVVCDDGLVCTSDVCNPLDDSCSNTLIPGWCLIAGVCYANGTLNPANSCEQCDSATSTSAWTPIAVPPNDLCGGLINIPVGSSLDGDTRCANPDYVDAGPCGRRANANDVTYDFDFTTGTDYQLYHYRVSESGSGTAPHPDPHVYARITCGDGSAGAEWRCNDDCWNGFFGTNYSTGCGPDPALSGVVVVNPVPVDFSQNTSVIADGEAVTRGTITTSVTRENHDNNDCRGSSAYHASPNMFPGAQPAVAQDVTWRGNNVGYGNVAGVAPSCGGAVDNEAIWRVSTPGTPPVHFFYDELAIQYDGSGATNAFDGVLQLMGPDGSVASCTDAANAGCSHYSGLGPASIVMGSLGMTRNGWLVLGSASREGQYELEAMIARPQFQGMDQWFNPLRPASSGGGNFDLECTRLDFAPDASATTGYAVTMTPTGCGWAVDPAGAPGNVVWEQLTIPWNYDDCSVNYPIGFNFLWGETFYTRMVPTTNGQLMLSNNPAYCSARCFDYSCADYTANRNEHYTRYDPELSPLWTDLVMCTGWNGGCTGVPGRITRQLAPVAAPTGEIITAAVLSWQNMGYYGSPGSGNVNFQAILYIDGRYSIVYQRISGSSTWGPSNYGIVGISGTSGVNGTAVNFR